MLAPDVVEIVAVNLTRVDGIVNVALSSLPVPEPAVTVRQA
jgi:hypothetical protein